MVKGGDMFDVLQEGCRESPFVPVAFWTGPNAWPPQKFFGYTFRDVLDLLWFLRTSGVMKFASLYIQGSGHIPGGFRVITTLGQLPV